MMEATKTTARMKKSRRLRSREKKYTSASMTIASRFTEMQLSSISFILSFWCQSFITKSTSNIIMLPHNTISWVRLGKKQAIISFINRTIIRAEEVNDEFLSLLNSVLSGRYQKQRKDCASTSSVKMENVRYEITTIAKLQSPRHIRNVSSLLQLLRLFFK